MGHDMIRGFGTLEGQPDAWVLRPHCALASQHSDNSPYLNRLRPQEAEVGRPSYLPAKQRQHLFDSRYFSNDFQRAGISILI